MSRIFLKIGMTILFLIPITVTVGLWMHPNFEWFRIIGTEFCALAIFYILEKFTE